MYVYEALIFLDINKSAGFDDISPKVLHSCTEALCEPHHHLFTLSLRYTILPSIWKIHKVVPIFKAGDPNSVKDYHASYFTLYPIATHPKYLND